MLALPVLLAGLMFGCGNSDRFETSTDDQSHRKASLQLGLSDQDRVDVPVKSLYAVHCCSTRRFDNQLSDLWDTSGGPNLFDDHAFPDVF